ncbi:MAG: hypothetical protein L0H53_13445 [Candidatus Nitrosocosmicus sp.]|nr:hypothetical protein [Candidatus Nitrosocosmicus sp.]MDN5868502.1 hypothetical protein [Candidatus Nitrosocosmicus sp.]
MVEQTIENDNEQSDIWELYLFALKSPQTREKYKGRINKFFDFVGVSGDTVEAKSIDFVNKSRAGGSQWVFNHILKFMKYQLTRVEHKEIVGSTLQNYLKSIKLFCDMADINIHWKKITRGLPNGKSYADDRIPTEEEIQRLLKYPDRRIKAIIYTMTSSGIRLGAWNYLRWGNIKPITKDGSEIVAAKMTVYEGEDEEYFTFLSGEAYYELLGWMKFREQSGELVNENSWVMRDLWNTDSKKSGNGLASRPKQLASSGIKRLMERAIWAQGLRQKLENGRKRHPFAAVHSFRKWFKTKCEIGGMRPIHIEILLSHSIGISNSYYRPTENDILDDYLKVMDNLLLDAEKKLQFELNHSKQDGKSIVNALNSKLNEKEEIITYLREKNQNEMTKLKTEMNEQILKIMKLVQQNPSFANVKPEVLQTQTI